MEVLQHLGDATPPWDAFLQTSKEFIGAEGASLVMFDGKLNLNEMRQTGHDSATEREYVDHFYQYDAFAQATRGSPAGKWWDSVELSSTPEARKLPFYADFMPRHKLGQVVALILLTEPGRHIVVSFQRMNARANAVEEFSNGNARIFTEALLRAVKTRVDAAAVRLSAVESALSSINEVVFLVNKNGNLVRCSPAAYEFLEDAKMLSATRREVMHEQPNVMRGMLQALSMALATSRPRQYCVPLSWGLGIRFDITAAPDNLRLADESLLMVRARKTSAFDVPEAAELATFFGLTVAESRVLLQLVEGHSPKDIAVSNAVAERTVRNQIASLMTKMSCTRMSELVRLGSLLR
ncbi:LuxR family transcriptional regulator [Caballeronia calidae]|uniref:LuxR family transcriptional regulator n=2 Tax=Caballeronia calidae TaxID=1777139 RepID=A0A158E0F1_9BURK|nr:LuxR family transcriptional regulator [Caballeronia calidae]